MAGEKDVRRHDDDDNDVRQGKHVPEKRAICRSMPRVMQLFT